MDSLEKFGSGMHAWFAAFADIRYSVVAPIIGVQARNSLFLIVQNMFGM